LKFRAERSASKVMMTVFWDSEGIILVDFFEGQRTVTVTFYEGVLGRLKTALAKKIQKKVSLPNPFPS
jgi:hypothetical protein